MSGQCVMPESNDNKILTKNILLLLTANHLIQLREDLGSGLKWENVKMTGETVSADKEASATF